VVSLISGVQAAPNTSEDLEALVNNEVSKLHIESPRLAKRLPKLALGSKKPK
jgi:hypothetical protein